VSHKLSRWQSVVLGLAVVAALALGGYGLARIAAKQGLWADTFEVTVGFPEAHDITPGTPVRIRGVEAGQVLAVEYPADDSAGSEVTVRLGLNAKFADRLYADGTAQVQGSGVFGGKVVSINPGTPSRGKLTTGRLRGLKSFNVDEVVGEAKEMAGEVKKLAVEAKGLVSDIRESNGTLMKLVKDDEFYRDLRELSGEARVVLKRANGAAGAVEGEVANLKGFVSDGRETLRSVKQGTDALSKMPLVRGYVEDAVALMVRPAHARERMVYNADDLFRPGTAILRESGKAHLGAVVKWLAEVKNKDADVVVVGFRDPADAGQTAASAHELTRKQGEVLIEHLRSTGVHKLGWFARRTMTPLGMGFNPSPVVEREKLPPSRIEVLLFVPQ
jgi:phospholipid/cholesterol/gamma-HCH transport system substrate-binding protein